jgi:hypothetical protein
VVSALGTLPELKVGTLVELNIMRNEKRPFSYTPMFRIMAVLFGTISVLIGWEAQSHDYLWNSGYNARIGTETTGTTLSWIIIGVLLILAGIFPWKWLGQALSFPASTHLSGFAGTANRHPYSSMKFRFILLARNTRVCDA